MSIISLKEAGRNHANGMSSFNGRSGKKAFAGRVGGGGQEVAIVNAGLGKNLAVGGAARAFKLTITNATANRKTFYLSNGLAGLAGGIAEGAFAPIEAGGETITANGSPQSIALFLAYFRQNPMFIKSMKITCSNALQLSESIFCSYDDPFELTQKTREIRYEESRNEYAVQTNIASINQGFIAAKTSIIKMSILPATSYTLTLYPDVVIDTASLIANAVSQSGGFDRELVGKAFIQ